LDNIFGVKTIDSLTGVNLAATWDISGVNSGTYQTGNDSLTFSFIDTLNGGALNDHYKFTDNGVLSGNIDGRSGTDVLDYSACQQGVSINLATGQATKIIGGISSMENVNGSKSDDLIIGDHKDNVLSGGDGNDRLYGGIGDDILNGGSCNDQLYGGAGNDILNGGDGDDELYGEAGNDTLDGGAGNDLLYGGAGNDTLYTDKGFNTLIGGTGTNKAIVSYGSLYEVPYDDIQLWVFLMPPSPGGESGGGGGAITNPPASQFIDSSVGGTISYQGVTVEVPSNVLPGNATISIKQLTPAEMAQLIPPGLTLKLGSDIYQITTSGERQFGENHFIKITIPFDPSKVPLGQRPVMHYFDEEQGRWVDIETEIEYDQTTGTWYAVVKVNHLTNFAVFASQWKPYLRDRYLTAAAISQTGWQSSDYAVLVRGDDYADALCAAPLASKIGGPLLLTETQKLNKASQNELLRLGVKHLILVGGTGAISQAVEDELKALNFEVERIGGADRYETSVKVAERIGVKGTVFLATGQNYPDAMSASVIASKIEAPILLTTNYLPVVVADYLETHQIQQTYIVGGLGVVSMDVERAVPGGIRLAGKDRLATNLAVIEYFNVAWNWENIFVATGNVFADGLTGSVLAAKTDAPMILIGPELPAATKIHLRNNLLPSTSINGLGGEKAVPDSILEEIRAVMQ